MTRFVHHVALRTNDLERCAAFYRELIGLHERQRHFTESGLLRSIWLSANTTIVMIELAATDECGTDPRSMELIAFSMEPDERAVLESRFTTAGITLEGSTRFSFYVRDPDGRRVGMSHFPETNILTHT